MMPQRGGGGFLSRNEKILPFRVERFLREFLEKYPEGLFVLVERRSEITIKASNSSHGGVDIFVIPENAVEKKLIYEEKYSNDINWYRMKKYKIRILKPALIIEYNRAISRVDATIYLPK